MADPRAAPVLRRFHRTGAGRRTGPDAVDLRESRVGVYQFAKKVDYRWVIDCPIRVTTVLF